MTDKEIGNEKDNEIGNEGPEPDQPDGLPRMLNWDEASKQIETRRQRTETQRYNFGDGTYMEFTYRGLTPREKNLIDSKMSEDEKKIIRAEMMKKKRGGRVSFRELPTEDNSLKWTIDQYLYHGITAGPPGFIHTDKSEYMRELGILPDHVRTDLVDRIDIMSDLDIEIEEGFREVGQG